jgi:WXXGXW repeat (2 copies)
MQFTSAFRNLLLALVLGGTPLASFAQVAVGVGVSINVAPPPLPVYDQPPCPADGDIWIPGYWAYGDDGYYWVSGYWTDPPKLVSSGRRAIGVTPEGFTSGMPVTGDLMLGFMGA